MTMLIGSLVLLKVLVVIGCFAILAKMDKNGKNDQILNFVGSNDFFDIVPEVSGQ